jgi:hypothetical protein
MQRIGQHRQQYGGAAPQGDQHHRGGGQQIGLAPVDPDEGAGPHDQRRQRQRRQHRTARGREQITVRLILPCPQRGGQRRVRVFAQRGEMGGFARLLPVLTC